MALVEINGTRLYVDERGAADAQPLLYVHGGPGNSCWDFMESVGDALAETFRVVGVDQRGVLRSDALPPGAPLTVDLLVEDFEALRVALGIDRWVILGHSAGGTYALDYALAHPSSVSAVVFDCPSWDCDRTDRCRLPKVAELLEAKGNSAAAARCRALADQPTRLGVDDCSWEAMQPLDNDYLTLFFHSAEGRAAYEGLVPDPEQSDLDWSRGMSHFSLLEAMYVDQMPTLAELTVPSALLRGVGDMVTPPDMADDYHRITGGPVHTFERSGHFSFIEQPEDYVRVVSELVGALVRR